MVVALLLIRPLFCQDDARLLALEQFLAPYPGRQYSADFLEAADRYQLDWTLLPAVCVAETGCGKRAPNNNMFGWRSGRKRFYSRRQGIYFVASRLAADSRYAGKPAGQQLKVYNPRRRSYPARIQKLMRKLNALLPG